MFTRSAEKRSPLKTRPLRNPGESLDREIGRLVDDEMMSYVFVAFLAVIMAAYEWWRWLAQSPPQPVPLSVVAIALVGYAAFRVLRLRRQTRALRLGLDGEKVVGQCLEELRGEGWRVFHDVPGEGLNLDHVILSPHGIVVVETKTLSKPARGSPTVRFDGERILVDGAEPSRDPVKQAVALGDWLKNLLTKLTGRNFPIRVAIVFPGWFVEPATGRKRSDLWVLNPKALPVFIKNEPVVLKVEDLAIVSAALADYVRTHD